MTDDETGQRPLALASKQHVADVAGSTTFRTLAVRSPCFNARGLEKYDRVALVKLVPNGATEPPARAGYYANLDLLLMTCVAPYFRLACLLFTNTLSP